MSSPPPGGSRDLRIEDPTNAWIIHPAGRSLLPRALRHGISANAVSVAGLCLGCAAAACFAAFRSPAAVIAGMALAIAWMIADGLDGMVARATGTASPFGRFLDGLCDHGVFTLIYCALAASIGTPHAWMLAVAAGLCHALQSNLYEAERARYHRRIAGGRGDASRTPPANAVVRLYDRVAGAVDALARPFDAALAGRAGPMLASAYGDAAAPPMRLLILLTANTRVWLLTAACLLRRPDWFWWLEIGPLSIAAALGIGWHRLVERRLLRKYLLPETINLGSPTS